MDELRLDRENLENEITNLVRDFENRYDVSVQLNSNYFHFPGDRVPHTSNVTVIVEV